MLTLDLLAAPAQADDLNTDWGHTFPLFGPLLRPRDEIRDALARRPTPLLEQCLAMLEQWQDLHNRCAHVGVLCFEHLQDRSDEARLTQALEVLRWIWHRREQFIEILGMATVGSLVGVNDGFPEVFQSRAHERFDELVAAPHSTFYRLCRSYNALQLWQSYLAFRDRPTGARWDQLASLRIPWSGRCVHEVVAATYFRLTYCREDQAPLRRRDVPEFFVVRRALADPTPPNCMEAKP